MKLIGHHREIDLLKRYLNRDFHSYSFLFEGKDCIGKKLVALIVAKSYLCEKGEFFGCGSCQSCKLSQNTIDSIYTGEDKPTHPDILVVSSEKGIKIDQIRQVNQFLKLKKKKVVIIEKAENMTVEGANALLKTLEEPPQDSIIILTTSNQQKLLPTITSRCIKVRFNSLSKEEIEEILTLKGVDQKQIKTLLALSDGSMCIPQAVLQEPKIFKYAKDLYNLLTVEGTHPEGIISLSNLMDKLELNQLNSVLQTTEKILYKKTLKGDIPLDVYDKFIKEVKTLKTAVDKGVKKKLALQGLYFNIKEEVNV
ncbi:MAG: DNA polymerase III subunit delta' [Aquificae bacterium]|nr:DNA polymerase III subunit delta' [Aquificota bacterium]